MAEIRTELRVLLTAYLADHPERELELADEFQVAVSTVRRWSHGITRPHPGLAESLLVQLRNRS